MTVCRPVGIGEPEQSAFQIVGNGHVRPAVAVDVAGRVSFQPTVLVLTNHVALEIAPTVVFQPVQRGFTLGVWRGSRPEDVRVGQVEVAVAIDVDGSQPESVAVLVRQQMLGEADRLAGRVEEVEDLILEALDKRQQVSATRHFLVLDLVPTGLHGLNELPRVDNRDHTVVFAVQHKHRHFRERVQVGHR